MKTRVIQTRPSQFHFVCLILLAIFGSGCSQNKLLTSHDYENSQDAYLRGDTENALLELPHKSEAGTFINTMEKGYLSLIQGKPQITELKKQAEVLESRVRFHVSREARSFFYVQTPEDYYASEHEVIWMHFLLSWGYSLQGKHEDACVEARISGSLLSLPWSPAGHFDDPAMRLFLAGLWAMCGEWHEAQVDLRAAWFMDNSLVWAKELAEHDQPPAHLFIVLGGPGPEPVWNPGMRVNPLRSTRQVSFKLRGQKNPLTLYDQRGVAIETHLSPDAGKWYERHLERENELHEIIMDSSYGKEMALGGALAGTQIVVTSGFGLLVAAGGTALGAAYWHFGGKIELALAFVLGGLGKGLEIAQEGYQKSTDRLRQDLDPTPRYRFVRYLPEYLWMGWSEQELAYPVELRTRSTKLKIQRPNVINRAAMTITYLPEPYTP